RPRRGGPAPRGASASPTPPAAPRTTATRRRTGWRAARAPARRHLERPVPPRGRREATVAVMSRMIRRRGDRGFTLVEVVVAMSLFAVAASVTLGLLLRTTAVAGDNIRRTAAANLAMKQIENVRSTKATSIPDGQ